MGAREPWFVVDKNPETNTVYVERGEKHPALYRDELWANELSWIEEDFPFELPFKCRAKIRYRQLDQDCVIQSIENGTAHVVFDLPQRAITVRQSIVFYMDDICLGGGMIEKGGQTYFEKKQNLPEIVSI